MKNKFKSNYLLISSISFPILCLLLIVFIVTNSGRPKESQSTYRKAIRHFESKEASPSDSILASNMFKGRMSKEQAKDYSSSSNIEIFNDKLSLPQEQLAYHLENLEIEHSQILKDLELSGHTHSEVMQLNLRYRIVLAFFLDINPGELTDQLKNRKEINSEQKFYLKKLSQSNDFKLLLEKNRLSPEYVQLENLKKLYATDEEISREISSEK